MYKRQGICMAMLTCACSTQAEKEDTSSTQQNGEKKETAEEKAEKAKQAKLDLDVYKRQEQERARLEGLRNTPAVTKDGKRIYLCANVGNVQDIRNALPMNIDGVGLFRSEFLYICLLYTSYLGFS